MVSILVGTIKWYYVIHPSCNVQIMAAGQFRGWVPWHYDDWELAVDWLEGDLRLTGTHCNVILGYLENSGNPAVLL